MNITLMALGALGFAGASVVVHWRIPSVLRKYDSHFSYRESLLRIKPAISLTSEFQRLRELIAAHGKELPSPLHFEFLRTMSLDELEANLGKEKSIAECACLYYDLLNISEKGVRFCLTALMLISASLMIVTHISALFNMVWG